MGLFIDYIIAESDSVDGLKTAVDGFVYRGYRPQGGMVTWTEIVSHYNDRDGDPYQSVYRVKFGQAMVKR